MFIPIKMFFLDFKHIMCILFISWSAYCYAGIPAGYYDNATGTGANLKTQLYQIISGHTAVSYSYLWTAFQKTDIKPNGKVWDMYSDKPNATPPYEYSFISDQCSTTSSEGTCYNREHSFPKSWFGGEVSPMYTDLFQLYPVDGYVNTRRNNNPYGEVSSPTWTTKNGSKLGNCSYPGYSGTVFEPIDEYKGDFARTYFYMATRYENVISNWYKNSSDGDIVLQNNSFPVYETWFLNMLGKWSAADPVSQKEIDRNEAIYSIQHNRNPFIDHPEYVYKIWNVGKSVTEPNDYPTVFGAYSIKLQWTDAVGAYVPTGYIIRMSSIGFDKIVTPADGVSYPDSNTDKNVTSGVQEVLFENLSSGTYYFKIYPYQGYGSTIDYKTDEAIPQTIKVLP